MSRRDGQAVERTVAAMETLLASGVHHVEVRHVLRLLGRDAPDSGNTLEPMPVRDPRADPLTDCLPVTAQGGSGGDREEGGREARRSSFRA